MDTPAFYFWLVYRNSGINQLKKNILEFCGVDVKKTTVVSPIRNSKPEFRKNWLEKIEQQGEKLE
jgi:putative NADPH-quinone reductase